LKANEHLIPGVYLESSNRSYRLYYRENGNVEIVKMPEGMVVWRPISDTPKPGRLMLQSDGNFVAYSDQNKPYWSSDKYFKDEQYVYQHSSLRLRDDGKIEVRVGDKEPFWTNQ
jgi:hypothetical protein